jgi:hypothetical protein
MCNVYQVVQGLENQGKLMGKVCSMHGRVHNCIKAMRLVKLIVRELQYSETNMMHFLFSVLRIEALYMFRALLAHSQETLH